MLKNDLQGFGLTPQEAELYLAGLESGPTSIQVLAKKTQTNRTTVYHTMAALLTKGLFSETIEGKKRLFAPEQPGILKEVLEKKLEQFDGISDQLLAISRTSSDKPVIKFYEGIEGIEKVFTSSAKAKEKKLYAFVGVEQMNLVSKRLLNFWLKDFTTLRKKNGVFGNLIMPDTEDGKTYKKNDAKNLRETKLLPKSRFNFPAEIMVHDDTLDMFVLSEKEQFAISIESPALANMVKMIFNLAWSQGY